jgi:hypothetical protein
MIKFIIDVVLFSACSRLSPESCSLPRTCWADWKAAEQLFLVTN